MAILRLILSPRSNFLDTSRHFLRTVLIDSLMDPANEDLISSVIVVLDEIYTKYCTPKEAELEIRVDISATQAILSLNDSLPPRSGVFIPVQVAPDLQRCTGDGNIIQWIIPIRSTDLPIFKPFSCSSHDSSESDISEPVDIHLMRPDEAEGVAKLMFEVYQYTYTKKSMYQPEQIWEKNASGEMLSVVAINRSGRVVGHGSGSYLSNIPGFMLLGSLAVTPSYRSRNIGSQISAVLIDAAIQKGIFFLATGPYTVHAISQKIACRDNQRTCAILPGSKSKNLKIMGITGPLEQRESFLIMGRVVREIHLPVQYLPIRHYAIITRLFNQVSLTVDSRYCESFSPKEPLTELFHTYDEEQEAGEIKITRIGKDLPVLLKKIIEEILFNEPKVIRLMINLSDCHGTYATTYTESLGFFFCGIIPSEIGIFLVMQYFTGFILDYNKIQIYDPAARYLLSYVASQDPSLFNKKPITEPKTLVVVDALSSGKFLPPVIKNKGLNCIHVISSCDIPEAVHVTVEELVRQTMPLCTEVLIHNGNIDELVHQLEKHNVVGIIPGSEIGVLLADQLSEKMELMSNGTSLSHARRNKSLMQAALQSAGVRTKKFLCSGSLNEILRFAENVTEFPVVLKPVDAAGTDGVTFCESADEVRQTFENLQGSVNALGSVNSEILVEERIVGTEFGVNTVSWNGYHKLVELWQYHKQLITGKSVIYDCTKLHAWPDEKEMEIVRYAFSVLDTLGIRFGPAHTEIILTKNGPVMVESGARPMGGQIPPNLIEDCIGQSQIGMTVLAYADTEEFLRYLDQPYQMKKYMIRKHLISTLEGAPQEEINAIDKIAALPSSYAGDFVSLLENWYIHKTEDMFTAPAMVFLIHEDERQIIEDYRKIREMENNSEYEFYGRPR